MPRQPGGFTITLSSNGKRVLSVIALLIVLFAIGTGIYFWCKNNTIDPSTYQAVFLSNGQVYFGKISSSPWSKYVRLKDIYHLQNKDGGQSQDLAAIASGDMTLIKLGNEFHAPTDKMEINREHILFIEDLKSDSKVVKAIQDYRAK
ncbi:hypothetical protein IT407_00430 [Candidatus Uhrbacteria bacterium]|nr:hypothetical protein [Candidatus Uhrbacteria bacterium]